MAGKTPTFAPWPAFGDAERAAVDRVLASGKLDYWRGGQVRAFEAEFAAYCGAPGAIAVSSGSAALEVGLRALGLGPGDDVIVPARSFIATASSVVLCGARPVFADVSRTSQNMEADNVLQALTPATRAVVCVHLAGRPCEMDALLDVTRDRRLALLEDCAQALGARYRGQHVGTFGDVGAFSFCQDKNITTGGEGGIVIARERAVRERAWSFKDHGKTRAGAAPSDTLAVYRWIHASIGTNLRMTEIQAAIGRVQLQQLPGWLAIRRANATALDAGLGGIPGVRVLRTPRHTAHGCYKYYLFLERRDPAFRDAVLGRIRQGGVPCLQGVCPEIYREAAFDGMLPNPHARLPVAAELGDTSLMLQIHPGLTPRHMEYTVRVVAEALEGKGAVGSGSV